MDEGVAAREVAVVKKEPKINSCKLWLFRVGGHIVGVYCIFGTGVVNFFPGAAYLLINNYNPVFVLTSSSLNVVARIVFGYYGLMYPRIEGAAQWVANENRAPATPKSVGLAIVVVAASGPFVLVFSLGYLYSMQEFQRQMANQTISNSTVLDFFAHVANITTTPAAQGILISGTSGFNLLCDITILLLPFTLFLDWKNEHDAILALPFAEVGPALRRYRIGMGVGGGTFIVIGTLGNILYFPFTAKMLNYFWGVPPGVGYAVGGYVFLNTQLLACLFLMSLFKGISEGLVDIRRQQFEWPSGLQIFANFIKAGVALVVVASGALTGSFNAQAAGFDGFLQIMSGILIALLEVGIVYEFETKVVERGIRYLFCCPVKNEEKKEEQQDGRLSRSSSVHSGMESSVADPNQDGGEFRGATPDPESQSTSSDDKKPSSWGSWLRSTFFGCCDGSRGKQRSQLRTSTDPLVERRASQSDLGTVTSSFSQPTFQRGANQ